MAKVRYTDVYVWNGAAWRLVSVKTRRSRTALPCRQQRASRPRTRRGRGKTRSATTSTVLRALNDNYVKAFREADVAWYDAHLAPDYVVVSGDGSFHDRAAALATSRSRRSPPT